MNGHAFLAVDLTDSERHAVSAALSEASPGQPLPGRRPPVDNWHITLRFIGECTDADADRVAHEIEGGLSAGPGRVFVSGLGAFPRASKASVVFAGIDDLDGLLAHLAGVCETAVRDVGFDPEERPFIPHLTLSRVRPPNDVRRVIEAFAPFRVPVSVNAITLFRSIPSRAGITYTPLHTIDLI
jgi:2'-5' RNA ligase